MDYYQNYFWRVRLVIGSSLGQWSDAWSFKTGIKTASLLLPADKSIDQPIALTLKWSVVQGATYYDLQVSKNETFTDLVFEADSITNTEQYVEGLLPGVKYFWRINDWNLESFGIPQWSPIWSFTTAQVTMTLSNPVNGSANLTIPIEFSWFPAATAVYYHLQLSNDTNFGNIILDKNSIYDTKYSLTEEEITIGTQYFWHVKGVNTQDNIPWSDGWQFTTSGVSVKESKQFTAIKLYPNPSSSKAVIRISYTESTEAKILINSADGKLVKSDILNLKSGETSYEINTDSLSSGTYYITIITPTGFISRELVVTK